MVGFSGLLTPQRYQNTFYKCGVYSRSLLEIESLPLFLHRSALLVLSIHCLTIIHH